MVLHGPSGAGKSTVLDLLAGLAAPEAGRATIGGAEAGALPEAARFRALAYLTQRTELFADTVAANLRIADPQAPEQRLWAALEAAGLAERIRSAPRGLDEWVGEGGSRLSGGEARRLALARVWLTDAPVVLLDEPLRGLDAGTAALVARRLAPWLAGRTAVIVSHEPDAAPPHHRRLALAELAPGAG